MKIGKNREIFDLFRPLSFKRLIFLTEDIREKCGIGLYLPKDAKKDQFQPIE